MTDDVLTKAHLEDAMSTMLSNVDYPPRLMSWTGPKWAVDILTSHRDSLNGTHVAECPDCQRAWPAMVLS